MTGRGPVLHGLIDHCRPRAGDSVRGRHRAQRVLSNPVGAQILSVAAGAGNPAAPDQAGRHPAGPGLGSGSRLRTDPLACLRSIFRPMSSGCTSATIPMRYCVPCASAPANFCMRLSTCGSKPSSRPPAPAAPARTGQESEPGTIIVFTSAKPGAGASTLAAQTAFALRRSTSKRVLLADFDLMGGMIGFYLKLTNTKSLLDAASGSRPAHRRAWASAGRVADGVDILPAPETPYAGPVDAARLHAVMEYARMNYDWIVVDVPVVFQRLSLMTISESDRAFLVTTSELPSLHLARKAVNLLDQLGFPQGALSDPDEPHRPARRNRRFRHREAVQLRGRRADSRTIISRCTARSLSASPWMPIVSSAKRSRIWPGD